MSDTNKPINKKLLEDTITEMMKQYYKKWNRYDNTEPLKGGKNADYIKILDKMDPNILQVSIIYKNPEGEPIIVSKYMSSTVTTPTDFPEDKTAEGTPDKVSIQSISKVFSLGLALQKHTPEFMFLISRIILF